jgi:hypothetical protein
MSSSFLIIVLLIGIAIELHQIRMAILGQKDPWSDDDANKHAACKNGKWNGVKEP